MSKQNDNPKPRREFLRKTLALIPIAAASGAVLSPLNVTATPAAGVSNQYVPVYFNNEEWMFILAACDRLIPSDANGPGAVTEGVPEFIDKQMQAPYGHGGLWYMHGPFVEAVPELGYQSKLTPREVYRIGIQAVNEYCVKTHQKKFSELSHEIQETILTGLEKETIKLDALPSSLFFNQILQNSKEGYLADPIHGGNQTMASWKMIGFPGARADYTDWVDQPNKPYPLGPVSISSKRSS